MEMMYIYGDTQLNHSNEGPRGGVTYSDYSLFLNKISVVNFFEVTIFLGGVCPLFYLYMKQIQIQLVLYIFVISLSNRFINYIFMFNINNSISTALQ